jgi:DNA repair exonuclease SbcCD nuclease subunit
VITLVWRTDVHLADNPPQSRTDNWSETLLGKLREVGEIARAVDAAAVLDGGDFFHVKSPTRNTHRLVHKVAQLHETYPCPVYANVGNHDCKYGDYDYLDEQPLGVLFETGVFHRCYDHHEAFFDTEEGLLVRVVGVPYHGTIYDMDRLTSIKKGKEDYLVVMAHLLASPSGGTMFENEDIVAYSDLAELDPDVWCYGHWHKDQGITVLPNGKQIVNIGSLSRGSLHQDEMDRRPAVAILTFTQDEVVIAKQELDVRPVAEVFDLEGRVRAEARDFSIEAFVDSIHDTLAETKQVDIPDLIREMPGVPEPVMEQAILYWENAL